MSREQARPVGVQETACRDTPGNWLVRDITVFACRDDFCPVGRGAWLCFETTLPSLDPASAHGQAFQGRLANPLSLLRKGGGVEGGRCAISLGWLLDHSQLTVPQQSPQQSRNVKKNLERMSVRVSDASAAWLGPISEALCIYILSLFPSSKSNPHTTKRLPADSRFPAHSQSQQILGGLAV